VDPDSLHRLQRSVQNEDALLSQSSLSNESLSNRYALFELLDPVLNDHDLRAAAGAYAPAMASNYNASLRPAFVLVKDGQARLMRRRETYDDLMRADVWPLE